MGLAELVDAAGAARGGYRQRRSVCTADRDRDAARGKGASEDQRDDHQ